jgi:hypothetical protein
LWVADSTEARHLCNVLPTRPSDLRNPGFMQRGMYLPHLVETADEYAIADRRARRSQLLGLRRHHDSEWAQ